MSTPAYLAASRMLVPSGTLTVRPSIVSETSFGGGGACGAVAVVSAMTSGRRRRRRRGGRAQRAALSGDVSLELVPELLDPRHARRRAGVAQHADCLPGHVLGDLEQRVEITHRALPRLDALE